jgi:hypothetical protein
MEDARVVIVHPSKWLVTQYERCVRHVAENSGYNPKVLEEKLDGIFSKYDGCHRAIIMPPKPSLNLDLEDDRFILTTRLHKSENDVIVSDFSLPEERDMFISWNRVARVVEEDLNLKPYSKLIVGGFVLNACVARFAKYAIQRQYEVYIDEMITNLFYNYLRMEIIGEKLDEQTFYRFEDQGGIFDSRLAEHCLRFSTAMHHRKL